MYKISIYHGEKLAKTVYINRAEMNDWDTLVDILFTVLDELKCRELRITFDKVTREVITPKK